jgi:hypothetical protein
MSADSAIIGRIRQPANDFLARILAAHGGIDRWNTFRTVEATIVSGGGFFALKGQPQNADPRQMTVWLDEERASVFPFGASDQRSMFTPERVAIEKVDGTVIAERFVPRDSFAGHQMQTPWDTLQRAYFNGEALWTYLTTPFLLALDGVSVQELNAWREGPETWRVLRAFFPGYIETHSQIQDFFFGDDLMLRRHDYSVNIAGGFAAAQLTSNYIDADGIMLPGVRRAYTRGADRQPIKEMLMVSMDFSKLSFSS